MTHERFISLGQLLDRQAELVRAVGRDVLAADNRHRIREFVTMAVATGAVLETKDERATAQGLVGYWTARMTTATREAARSTANDSPAAGSGPGDDPLGEVDSLLAAFDPATVVEATTRADAWFGTLREETDRALVRRILVRLVRLQDDGTAVHDPVSRFALDDLEPRQRAGELLDELRKRGVVRVEARPNGGEEVSLTSGTFVDTWPFLREMIAGRQRFRTLADEWQAHQSKKKAGGFRHVVKRFLLNAGRAADGMWSGLLRTFGGPVVVTPDPAADLPDTEFYRYRTQAEIDFQFYRRTLERENADWLRIVKGISLFAILALVGFGLFALVTRELKTREFQNQEALTRQEYENQEKMQVERHKQALSDQEVELNRRKLADAHRELEQRRRRQRLKEHVALVRLLAQYRQYKNPANYPVSDAARWKIEAPLSRKDWKRAEANSQVPDRDLLQEYQVELTLIGVSSTRDKETLRLDPSALPLTVAHNIRRELIRKRIADPTAAEYDEDTFAYCNSLIRELYTATGKLVDELCKLLSEPGSGDRPHNYHVLAGYMDEFWILYYGELAVVESDEVERLMVVFGEALKAVDDFFAAELEGRLQSVDPTTDRTKGPAEKSWNAAAKSYFWSAEKPTTTFLATRANFLHQPIRPLRGDLKGSKGLVAVLQEKREVLVKQLEDELCDLPVPPEPEPKK